MSMLNCFFSLNYANRGDLFTGLNIWQCEEYRKLHGTNPVIFLSLASTERGDYQGAVSAIISQIEELYRSHRNILSSEILDEEEKQSFRNKMYHLDKDTAIISIKQLCKIFYRVYNKKSIVLLDEYDTSLIKAYNKGYWEEFVDFMRQFFNAAFKTNPYLGRGIMTGVTRVAKESIFSGLNNLNVYTITSPEYDGIFGFTKQEVFAAMDALGKSESEKQEVKRYYDGFTFGNSKEIYNPCSIIH